jgi:hypothetical protein
MSLKDDKQQNIQSCHRTLRLIYLELELLRDELRDALHHPLPRPLVANVDVAVIRISNETMTPALQLPVELVEHEVTEQWRKGTSLRSPFHTRADQPVLHHPGIQECPNEFQQPLVLKQRCWNWGCVRGWRATRLAAATGPGISHGLKPLLLGFPMRTSNRSAFRHCSRNVSGTYSNRRVRTRMHGGVAGVGGRPPPLCRSSRGYRKLAPETAIQVSARGLRDLGKFGQLR